MKQVNSRYFMLILSSDEQSSTLQTLQAIEKSQQEFRTQNYDLLTRTRQELLAQIQESRNTTLKSLNEALFGLSNLASVRSHQSALLRSLYFDGIQTRYHSIHDAHTDTFNWFYDPPEEAHKTDRPPHAFRRWLESGLGVYYIIVCQG